jgi:hypothetical protein
MREQDLYKQLESLIDSAFKDLFKEKNIMQTPQPSSNTQVKNTQNTPCKYSTIKEYTEATGKRFRMTKEQLQRGISREEAFREFIQSAD